MMRLASTALFLSLVAQASAVLPSNLRKDSRNLQGKSPCSISFEDATFPAPIPMGELLKPSYVANCYRSLEMDSNLMAYHIDSLRKNFQDYFCFYDLANDAADSDPQNFSPELGYSLFSGQAEGQVNLEKELTDLIEAVNVTGGANLGTFFEIQTIFNKLRDAHVSLGGLAGVPGELLYTVFFVFPGRNIPEATAAVQKWEPSYKKNGGELELKVEFQMEDGSTVEEQIVSIDGKSPYEWYYSLVSNPAFSNYPFQSVGARMNEAFKNTKAQEGAPLLFLWEVPYAPPDAMPDSFLVAYASGEEETYYVGTLPFSLTKAALQNATDVYDIVNSDPELDAPGPPFEDFLISIFQVANATAADVRHIPPAPPKKVVENDKPKTKAEHGSVDYAWDQTFVVIDLARFALKEVGGYKIEDDYGVFKIWDFDFLIGLEDPYDLLVATSMWSNFTAAAKAKGVKKAIVDISGNGGGIILSGYQLAIAMYPFAPFEVFKDVYDITYNEAMAAYESVVSPVFGAIQEALATNTSDADLQEYLESFSDPDATASQLQAVGMSLLEFCCGSVNVSECVKQTPCGQKLEKAFAPLETLFEFPNGPQLRAALNGLFEVLPTFDPFSVLDIANLDRNFTNPVIRGGVPMNLTNRFTGPLTEELYWQIVGRTFQNDWMFDEYTIVSDGTGGSTTMLFVGTLMELWNNRDRMPWNGRDVPPAPLTTITYGGTKIAEDTTVAGFPASVQETNIANPIICAGLLLMLEALLPDEISELLTLLNDFYSKTLATPPYYSARFPTMPVFNFYSNFMGPGAIPMQYIKMFSDRHYHIPQIYTGTTDDDTSDLTLLYKQAAKLGFSQAAKPPPQEDSEDLGFMHTPPESSGDF